MAAILIVDDDPAARDLIATVLNYGGHSLEEASDGAEGLALAELHPPELIVADLLMPTMDGFEFVRRLRDNPVFARTPVIFYTASYLEKEARNLANACGVKHIITKPAEPEHILAIVSEALGDERVSVPPPPIEEFQREHVKLLTSKLLQKAEHAIPRFNAMIEIGLELAAERDRSRLLQNFCASSRKVIGAKYSAIALLDSYERKLRYPHVSGISPEATQEITESALLMPVLDRAMANRGPRRLGKHGELQDSLMLPEGFPPTHVFLSAPIASPDRVYGWVCFTEKVGGQEFTDEDEALASLLAAQVGRIYENGSLYSEIKLHADELEQELVEKARVEKALRESEERFRRLIEEARDAIFTLGPDRTIRSVNAAFEGMSGWPGDEWLGCEFLPLVHPDDAQGAVALFQRVMALETPSPFELRLRMKGGGYLPMEFTVTAQVTGGVVTGIIGIGRDIRERKQLEEQLLQSQKMESIGQLAGGVAHDFNNLLTVIQGHTDLVKTSPGLPNVITDSIREISLAAKRAAGLTRQLLTFSRQQVIEPRNLDLNEIVAQTTKMLHRLVGEHIAIKFAPSFVPATVYADPGMMEQILMNLAVNARDAMPGGGALRIELSVETIDADQAGQQAEASVGRFVRLTVSDEGCGISKEHLSKVFEPFFTTKEEGKGTGLGLATVFGIVKQHRGWVTVQSEVHQGTMFRIFLPLRVTAAKAPEPPVAPAQLPRGGAETIMVVEDEETLRRVVRSALERFGYRVVVANSAVAALRLWHEIDKDVDLVLTDIVMPEGLSGHDLAGILKAERPELPIILSTGYTDRFLRKDQMEGNGVKFLRKPYDLPRLLSMIRESLDSRPQPVESL